MAINKPIIAAGPAKQRGHVLDQRVQTYGAGPGETYNTTDSNGFVISASVPDPTREGQIYVYAGNDNGNRFANMYVGVNVSGTLTWVPIDTIDYLNPYTGQPIDPMFP